MSLDFKDRLRPASLVSPSGIEIEFLTDTLSKKGGKKLSTHEIVDSDESVTQDQGNKTNTFPFSIYFINDGFDSEMTDFENLLKERCSVDSFGILHHPLWGDVNVCPISWDMGIELVSGVGIGRMSVEFIEIFPRKYPESTLNNSDLASSDLDNMSLIDQAAAMAVSAAAAASNVAGKIKAVTGAIQNAAEFLEKVEDEMTAIQNEINNMIDNVGGNLTDILMTTQRLIRSPSRFADTTMNKINTYKDICDNILSEIKDEKESNPVNLKNNAVLVQVFGGFSVGCLAESALSTTFSTKADVISAVETINEALENYNTALSNSRTDGKIENEYSGDHNFQLLLSDAVARVNDIILTQSFSLKSEKKITIKNNSDAITLCYENYGKVDSDTILYFLQTNNISNDEFLDIPAGRQVVFYV